MGNAQAQAAAGVAEPGNDGAAAVPAEQAAGGIAEPGNDDAAVVAAEQVTLNLILSSGASYALSVEASDSVVALRLAFEAVHEVPPACNVKLFQEGQILLDDLAVSALDIEQPVFAVIVRETKVEILLQAAGSYSGYAELLQAAQTDPSDPTAKLVGPMPSILYVLEELGGQVPELETLCAGPEGSGLEFRGEQGELILPSLDAKPLLAAAGKASFSRVTLCVELNSDAFNRGLGVIVQASPLFESTMDDSGIPAYVYNGYGLSDEKKQNAIKFHPGMAGGCLRVEGPGGWGNTHLFTPANWTASGCKYHTMAITLGADGENTVQLRGTEDGQVWQKKWRRQLTEGKHIPALYAWLDLGGPRAPPLHIGQISLRVHID